LIVLAYIVALLVVSGLLTLIVREVRRRPGAMKWGRRPVWPKCIRIAAEVVLLLAVCVVIWSTLIELNRLVINSQTIQIAGWPQELNGLRIAALSDIHTGGPFIDEKKLNDIVNRTNALNPDLIVICGDYMSGNSWHGHRVEPEVTAAALKNLRAPLGVYAVLGNHDWWYNGGKVRRSFETNGIHILEDEVAELNWHGKSFWLAGFADLWTRPQHIMGTVEKIPVGATTIGITHNPDVFPRLPQSVSLLIAGHTHGGQVNIPLLGTPVVPSDYGAKYTAGHVFENNHDLFVTSGIGISILPVRFRVPPEIALLTIVTSG
jgi:uncharacterized protein